jgi:hypothetical protein
MKRFKFLSIIIVIIIVVLAIIPLFVVGCSNDVRIVMSETETFDSFSDAYVVMTGNKNWNASRDSIICNQLTSPGSQVEASFYFGAYDIYRTFLYFDTSSISEGAQINDVKLSIFLSGVMYNQDDVSIYVVSGNDDISFPAVCCVLVLITMVLVFMTRADVNSLKNMIGN